jgi:hypothetical protein
MAALKATASPSGERLTNRLRVLVPLGPKQKAAAWILKLERELDAADPPSA